MKAEQTTPACVYMATDEIERIARLAYNAASTVVPLDQVVDDGWWDGFHENEREEWRRAVRVVLREAQIG